jgi:hypothetical protein
MTIGDLKLILLRKIKQVQACNLNLKLKNVINYAKRVINPLLRNIKRRKSFDLAFQIAIGKGIHFMDMRLGIIFGAPKFSMLDRRKKIKIAIVFIGAVIIIIVLGNVPRWWKMYEFRTHFRQDQKRIVSLSEEEARKEIDGECDKIRAKAGRLYASLELSRAISAIPEKQIFIGNGENNGARSFQADNPMAVINTSGKDLEIKCFEFQGKVVIKGNGKIDFGWNVLRDVSGNALYLGGANGKIHHNIIENSTRAGIFAESGNWEISQNIIKNNKSYGIYGSYETNVSLWKNYIGGNSGYQVRLLKNREVYK